MRFAGPLLLLLSLARVPLRADGAFAPASLAAPFENAVSSARAAGMGGAAYFSDNDAALFLQNPASTTTAGSPTSSRRS
jgi:hypothetical protein